MPLMLHVYPSSRKWKKQHHPYLRDPAAQNMLQNKHSQDKCSDTLIRSQMNRDGHIFLVLPTREVSLRKRPSLATNEILITQEQEEYHCLSVGSRENKLILMFLGLILGKQISLMLPLSCQLFLSQPVWSAKRDSLCLPVYISRMESNSKSLASHSSNGNTCWKY